MFDVTGLVIGTTFLLATAAFIWKMWTRYLQHRETIKRIENKGAGVTTADHA